MGTVNTSFHRVVSATAAIDHVHSKGAHWLTLTFEDSTGGKFAVRLFSESPEALLESLAVKATAESA